MINLLSPDDQHQLAAARTNTLILRYVFLMSVVIAVMAVEMLGVYLLLNNDMRTNQALIDTNDEKAKAFESVQKDANSFRTNLAISKYILGKQVPYTSIIFAIANALPAEATLDALRIEPSTFGTPSVMTVKTNNPDTAIEVKLQLQQARYNNKNIFTSVSFDSIAAPAVGATDNTYTATFRVTYSKELTTQ